MVIRMPTRLVPPLHQGDKLTRDEFEKRYDAMPKRIKAELINGVVYMASPIRFEFHSEQHGDLLYWLRHYKRFTRGTRCGTDATLRLDLENEPQPDSCLFIDPDRGGQARIDAEGYLTFAPDFAGEVAASSASYDLHEKLALYRRFKVREYLVWRVYDEIIDWFYLRGTKYLPIQEDAEGVRRSRVFPGLWLDGAAMVRGDMDKVIEVLEKGLATKVHAAFVAKLNK